MLFNLVWSSSWSAALHPQHTGLAVGWNFAWPQAPNVCRLKTLMDTGSKWHNNLLLDPVTTVEHPRGSLWLCSKNKNISGDFKDNRSQKFPCAKILREGKDPYATGTALFPFWWSGLRYLQLQKVEGAEDRSPEIMFSSASKAEREGEVIHADMHPSCLYLHILSGCICYGGYFRSVLSLYIQW